MTWQTCPKGHDLTIEDAWLYGASGNRECRECALARNPNRSKRIHGWDTALGSKFTT